MSKPGLALILVIVAVWASPVALARADGEVGLVVQNGDEVTSWCIPFKGEGIDGDDLLAAAGLSFDQFGGAGGRTLCSIDDVGCFKPGSFNGCFCECSGGGSCQYWAFFTQRYGAGWVYSALAFNLTRAKDGDLQGWKWGKGSLQSAPVPATTTFERVCGHSPLSKATAVPSPSASRAPSTTAAATVPATPSPPTAEVPASAEATPAAASTPEATPLSTLPAGSASNTVTLSSPVVAGPAPAASRTGSSNDGGREGAMAFGVVATAMIAVIGATLIARRKRGT